MTSETPELRPGSLQGVRVAAFTHFAAGPLTVQLLGSLGADVIKVESPYRDLNRYAIVDPDGKFGGVAPYFTALNNNQRCLGLDLRSEDGRAVARRLIAASDVVVENHRPGSMEKLGLGYEDARRLNDKTIYCSISAYDLMGPSRNVLGQDLLLQALSGLMSLNGREADPPTPVGVYLVDAYTSMFCAVGILSALIHRNAGGQGQRVRVDMMSSILHMMAQEASYQMNVDPAPRRSRSGVAHVDQSAPYGTYVTRDGAFVMSLCSPETVGKIAETLGVYDRVKDFLSVRGCKVHRDEIVDALASRLRDMTTAEALEILAPTGVWTAPVRSLMEALDDPAIVAAGIIETVKTDYPQDYRFIREPLKMSETPLVFSRSAPKQGEHTVEVLSELGYDEAAIRRLMAAGAAFGPPE
jgi:crotonobetainyl-CoA:carnitine CoA-transferase CaiB-like acyl-CoA transferase